MVITLARKSAESCGILGVIEGGQSEVPRRNVGTSHGFVTWLAGSNYDYSRLRRSIPIYIQRFDRM